MYSVFGINDSVAITKGSKYASVPTATPSSVTDVVVHDAVVPISSPPAVSVNAPPQKSQKQQQPTAVEGSWIQPSPEVIQLAARIRKLEDRNKVLTRERNQFQTLTGYWHIPFPDTGLTRLEILKEEKRKAEAALHQSNSQRNDTLKTENDQLKKNAENWKDIAFAWREMYRSTEEGRLSLDKLPALENILMRRVVAGAVSQELRQESEVRTTQVSPGPLILYSDPQVIDLTDESSAPTTPELEPSSNPRKRRRRDDAGLAMALVRSRNDEATPELGGACDGNALEGTHVVTETCDVDAAEAEDSGDELERALLAAFAEDDALQQGA